MIRSTFVLALLCVAAFSSISLKAENPAEKRIKFGVTEYDGKKYEYEFREYSPRAKHYRSVGFDPFYVDKTKMRRGKYNASTLYAELKRYNVVLLETHREGVPKYNERMDGIAKEVAQGLAMYVMNGGGLIIQISAVRYPTNKDEVFWNECVSPFGLKLLHEGVFDPENKIKFSS